jgi:N-acetylneuraminic acid mutarotase
MRLRPTHGRQVWAACRPRLVCRTRREARVLCCSSLCASAVGSELASRRAARRCVLRVACCRVLVCAVNSFPKGSQHYLATAAAGNSVYVLDHPTGPATSAHKYSAAMDVWTTIRRIPTWRAGTEHAASAATVGNRIYVVGGLTTNDNAKNEAYDTQTDTWATKAALPVGRAGAAVGVRSNKIYVVAGYSLLSTMNVYTPSTDAWTSGASRSDL